MAMERPDPGWGGPRGEVSSAYADDTHSGGWAISCIIKSLRRIAQARDHASLQADPLKCKVLTSEALRPHLDALLDPLRRGDPDGWQVVTHMRVLGVTLSDPTDRAELERRIGETLRVRVVAPTDRLIAELDDGAKPATAYFALTRFVIPNALYHMQVWGLLCTPDVWAEVDAAFTRFCVALCPLDQRGRLRTQSSALRAELSLPQDHGGLGIPRVEHEARLRAADQWSHRDAREAGMLPENIAAAYRRADLDRNAWVPRGMDPFFKAVGESLADGLSAADARDLAWRRGRNSLRAALWAFNAVPWVNELILDRVEWDVAWHFAFGGVAADTLLRLDRPDEGHTWRGRRMEYAVAEAVRETVPAGVVSVWPQPSRERTPPDHEERCRHDEVSPEGWRRADIAFAFTTGKVITLDVRTTDTQCASARHPASAEAFLRSQEREKTMKYEGYYKHFRPFVIDLTGAVTETSYGVLREIAKEAAKAAGKARAPRLHWEPLDWAVRVQRLIAVAMVRTTAWLVTRGPGCARPASRRRPAISTVTNTAAAARPGGG